MVESEPGTLKAIHNPSDKLSKRDWLLLPAISLATIFVLLASTELTARRLLPRLSTWGEDCMVFDDLTTGARAIPNSVCRDKLPDTEYSEYRFNSCGFRTPIECGRKPQGIYRIVMIGSSFATGMRVPVEKTFAVLLPEELSRRTGRAIQLYNEGMPWRPPRVIAAHMEDVLAAKPDLLFWVVTPSDIGETSRLVRQARQNVPAATQGRATGVRGLAGSTRAFLSAQAMNQTTGPLLRALLYHVRTLYVRNYLMRGSDSDFLRTNPGLEWDVNLKQFESYADAIEERAEVAGVPVVVTFLPNRAQAAMLSMGTWPEGSDPYKIDGEVRTAAGKHGGIYLDIVHDFRDIPDAEGNYYPVDGHPDARGHALITRMLAEAFMESQIPAFRPAAVRADKGN